MLTQGGAAPPPRWLPLALVSALLCVALAVAQGAENTFGNMGYIHVREARHVLLGDGFGHFHYADFVPDLFTRPTYTLFLAPLVAVLGDHWDALRAAVAALQGLLNAATAIAVAAVLCRAGDARAARLAAWGIVLHPVLVSQGATFVDTVIFAAAFIGAFGLAWLVPRDAPLSRWAAVGLVLGVAIVTRFTAVMIAPAILVLVVRRHASLARAAAAACTAGLCAFLVCAPWLVRNHALTDRWMLSTSDGVNLWMGNNPDTARFLDEDRSLDDLPGRPRYDSVLICTIEGQVETCDAAKAAAAEFMREHPREAAVLAVRKAGDLWSVVPTPRSTRSRMGGIKNLVGAAFTLPLYLLGVVGVIAGWRRGGEMRVYVVLALVTAAAFTVPHAIAWGGTRLRAPLDPLIVGLAAIGAAAAIARFRARRADA